MIKSKDTRRARAKRRTRIRGKIHGVAERPRLVIYRSINHIYAQVVDDTKGYTLVAASTLDAELRTKADGTKKGAQAEQVGELVARRAIEQGISKVVFDRGGYLYHGRIKALADGARKAGLVF